MWVGDDCWRAPARPRNGGVPSTARPSHLGGRASCTWRNTDREPLAKCPGDKRNLQGGAVFASNRRRPQRGRRPQTQKLTSACARRQCPPLSRRTHHRPLSPPTCLVCTCWGNRRLHREAAPSRRLDGYQNSSLRKRPTDPRKPYTGSSSRGPSTSGALPHRLSV